MVINNEILLQYGYLSSVAQGGSKTVTFPKAFTTKKYASFSCPYTKDNLWANAATKSKTVTTVQVFNISNTGGNRAYHWYCIGF